MNQPFEYLEWDSQFFKMNIWKLSNPSLTSAALHTELKQLHDRNAQLIYWLADRKHTDQELFSNLYECHLVDTRVTYLRKAIPVAGSNFSISVYDQPFPEKKLIDLAIQSGQFSRFRVDKNIPNSACEELYSLWITNSVNKKIAREVLVYRVDGEIVGFITVGEKNNKGDIGISAIDPDFRGRGIGKALFIEAINWFARNGYSEIQVVTQAANKPANKLFESCGFAADSVAYWYHLWRKNSYK